MYSAYKLNKQGDNIGVKLALTYSFPIWNQSIVPCPALTNASWWLGHSDSSQKKRAEKQGKLFSQKNGSW